MHFLILRGETEPINEEINPDLKEGRVNQPCKAKKRAKAASAGQGRRPHPCFLSRRLRFCPAARMSALQLTRQRSRKRKHLIPCQSLPSAKSGSTHTLRLRKAFLYDSVG